MNIYLFQVGAKVFTRALKIYRCLQPLYGNKVLNNHKTNAVTQCKHVQKEQRYIYIKKNSKKYPTSDNIMY